MVEKTIKEVVEKTENASTTFEKTNTEAKRLYIKWNIDVFNQIAQKVSVTRGSFGTGYPFYVLDEKLEGEIPIISEQLRYNRQLVRDGEPYQKSIWLCKECLKKRYSEMPDLKVICKPCPNTPDELKPRKILNRLPDIDMWLVCEDGKVEQAQEELAKLLKQYTMYPSDVDPLETLEDVEKIAMELKNGSIPPIFLPVDAHIIEESKLGGLIAQVPCEIKEAKKKSRKPYLPIRPKSYRKDWQYDDEAYNFIYDYLSAFTPFNFSEKLEPIVRESRARVARENTPEELFGFLMQSATASNFRRFQEVELEEIFYKRIAGWSGQPKEKKEEDGR